jgi:hypothetical protein
MEIIHIVAWLNICAELATDKRVNVSVEFGWQIPHNQPPGSSVKREVDPIDFEPDFRDPVLAGDGGCFLVAAGNVKIQEFENPLWGRGHARSCRKLGEITSRRDGRFASKHQTGSHPKAYSEIEFAQISSECIFLP